MAWLRDRQGGTGDKPPVGAMMSARQLKPMHPPRPFLVVAIALATLLPTAIAYNLAPATTYFNNAASLMGWGLVLLLVRLRCSRRWGNDVAALAALGLLALGIAGSTVLGGAPVSAVLAPLASVAAAAAVVHLGQTPEPAWRRVASNGLIGGWVLVGAVGFAIGAVQYFVPAWTDGNFIASTALQGRAVGNVRQPNQLATLLLCSAVAVVWAGARWRLSWRWVAAGVTALMAGVVMTASRTGLAAGIPLLLLWGLLDGSLPRRLRAVLWCTPIMAATTWASLDAWAHFGGQAFGAAARLDQEGAGSPSRLAILRDTWTLIQQHPWGVGWGEFNRAWTLTPFPERPIAFFDHCHNLPLQLVVELGWLVGGGVLLALAWALVLAARRAFGAIGDDAVDRRATLLLLLMVSAHSMLEYPLWYPYFLLPTALALGLCSAPLPLGAVAGQSTSGSRWAQALGALLIVGGAWATMEFYRVVDIYAPAPGAASLPERVARGQDTLFFGARADYAGATALGTNAAALAAASRAGHQLIDARLLINWAKSLHAVGETDRARYLVARLREFRSREGDAWLAVCNVDSTQWFCQPPLQHYDWRSF